MSEGSGLLDLAGPDAGGADLHSLYEPAEPDAGVLEVGLPDVLRAPVGVADPASRAVGTAADITLE